MSPEPYPHIVATQMSRAPNAALHSVKRFLGQTHEVAQKELSMLPFEVEERNGKVFFKIPFHDEETTFHPEEVASMMIKAFRTYIDAHLGASAAINKGCVVAVSAADSANETKTR